MNKDIRELLEEIQDWMMENDYECGPHGSEIYQRISEELKKYDKVENSPHYSTSE